jgi:hypothetical protein
MKPKHPAGPPMTFGHMARAGLRELGAQCRFRVSYFIQPQERGRLKVTNAGHLPQPPRTPRWPVRPRPRLWPVTTAGVFSSARPGRRPRENHEAPKMPRSLQDDVLLLDLTAVAALILAGAAIVALLMG